MMIIYNALVSMKINELIDAFISTLDISPQHIFDFFFFFFNRILKTLYIMYKLEFIVAV